MRGKGLEQNTTKGPHSASMAFFIRNNPNICDKKQDRITGLLTLPSLFSRFRKAQVVFILTSKIPSFFLLVKASDIAKPYQLYD
jgi:hypothetical protein